MALASGVAKVLSIKKQAAFGTAESGTGGQILRRTTADLGLVKDTYESKEIVNHAQIADFRHGVRRIQGNIAGELSAGTYKLFMQSLLRRDFVAGVNSGALTDVTAAAGPPGTFTRGTGSWITSGFKKGDIVRWTGWTTGGANNNARNYRITDLTALVMTVTGTGNEVVAAKVAGDSVTATVTGKKTFIPVTAHTSDYYTIEQWFADIAQSEAYADCVVGSMNLRMPATGLAEVTFGILGRSIGTGTAQVLTTPTAATTSGIAAAVNGLLSVGGTDQVVVTGMDLTVDLGLTSDAVIGANVAPTIWRGRSRVTGSLTAFFENATIRDAFINETASSLAVQLALGSTINADFLSITMQNIKFGGATKNDGEQGIVQTMPFVALLDGTGSATTNTENTTVSIQDSLA